MFVNMEGWTFTKTPCALVFLQLNKIRCLKVLSWKLNILIQTRDWIWFRVEIWRLPVLRISELSADGGESKPAWQPRNCRSVACGHELGYTTYKDNFICKGHIFINGEWLSGHHFFERGMHPKGCVDVSLQVRCSSCYAFEFKMKWEKHFGTIGTFQSVL